LPNNTVFNLDNVEIEIVKHFTYLGILFSTGGSYSEAQSALSGQALKAIFQINKYLHKFTSLSVQHRLDIFGVSLRVHVLKGFIFNFVNDY